MHHLVQLWFEWVEQWGYLGIILLMAMESSIFPVPSEIVIPPAAFLASEGKLNMFGVIAAGTFGSWLGATLTYWAALWLGRVFIARWGGYFLCAAFACDPPCHFYPGWNHSDEFRQIQRDDPGRIGALVFRPGVVWPK